MAKAKLNDEQRRFVVRSLACFDKPGVIRDSLKRDYGVEVTLEAIEAYDPTKSCGTASMKRWAKLFHEIRKAFVAEQATIAVFHRSVRLRALDRLIERLERQGNLALAAQLLEQAAKEVGDCYTNKQKVDVERKDVVQFSMNA